MAKISVLTLALTEKCNFSCAYCPQHRGKKTLKIEDITAFLDFLKPRLANEVWLGFYGGEPLLCWPLIEKTVAHVDRNFKKKFHFSLTTNGSLLNKEQILFFKKHRFELVLSYDGLAQEKRDPGSIAAVEAALQSLRCLYSAGYTVNSVFTPATVSLLSVSSGNLMEQGHKSLQYSLDLSVPWQPSDLRILESELERLAGLCLEFQRKTGTWPLETLKSSGQNGIFACFAGRDRLALLPDRTVWGCYLFYDLLGHNPGHADHKKYCFGKLPAFIGAGSKNRAVAAHYRELRQDYFFTVKRDLCTLCDRLKNCGVCPVIAALATAQLGVIPDWTCRIKQLQDRLKPLPAGVH